MFFQLRMEFSLRQTIFQVLYQNIIEFKKKDNHIKCVLIPYKIKLGIDAKNKNKKHLKH